MNDDIHLYGTETKKKLSRTQDIDPIMPKFKSVLSCNSSDAP